MRGVLLIALKSPLYGRMAYNLLQSIKATCPDLPVTLVCDAPGALELDAGKRFFFDKIITCPEKYYMVGGKSCPLVAKFHLYDLTPYDQTLFLDADTILSSEANLTAFLDELSGVAFTMANRGLESDTSQWLNKTELTALYNPEKWYDLSSEVIYFEKGETAKNIFKAARKFYDAGKLPVRVFAGDKPDEPFFGLAMDKAKVYPHKSPWKPLCWFPQEAAGNRPRNIHELQSRFLGMSAGGRYLPKHQLKLYTQMCGTVAFKTGHVLFPYLHKFRHLPERQDI